MDIEKEKDKDLIMSTENMFNKTHGISNVVITHVEQLTWQIKNAMCIDEHILGEVVEVHDVVLLDVHLVDGPSELTNMITTFLICHVYY